MAAAGGISQGAFGFVRVGGHVILARTGASLAQPRNKDMPHPISGGGNDGIVNVADGLQFPVINVPAIPLDTDTWLNNTNFNLWFINRNGFPTGDLTEISGLTVSDTGNNNHNRGVYDVSKPKGAGFTIVMRKGQGIGITMRFAGRNKTPPAGDVRPGTALRGAPLMFDRIVLDSNLDGKGIVGMTLSYDTALTPNMELDGTIYPYEQNAGLPSGTLTLEYNAIDNIAPLGYEPVNDTWYDVDDSTLQMDTGVNGILIWTMSRLSIRDPFNRQTQANRVQRTFTYDLIGNDLVQAPLLIAGGT